jgi:stage II sporulation protein D
MKLKLTLIGICVCLLILIFASNIYKKITNDDDKNQVVQDILLREKEMIAAEEALRLLSYLGLTEDEMRASANISTPDMSQESDEILKTYYLKFGQCLTLIETVSNKLNLTASTVIQNLYFDIQGEPSNKAMLTEEFLNVYESILDLIPEESSPVSETTMFVLGTPNTELNSKESNKILVTDQGSFTYINSSNYDDFYINGKLSYEFDGNYDNQKQPANEVSEIENDPLKFPDNKLLVEHIIDSKVLALVSGTEIIYIKDTLSEETILHNVWIETGAESTVSAFLHNVSRDFKTKYKLSQEIVGKISDITILDKEIIKITLKPDVIGGKVLVANKDYIELEGYGKIDLDDNYKIYKIYDELSMEVTNSILVGYEATDFVVADGKIVAALIKDTIKAENIRVLLKTSQFENIYHDKIKITADHKFTVTVGEEEKSYKAGEEITFKTDDDRLKQGRVHVKTNSENGKIKILSLERLDGNPEYRGSIEISSTDSGLIIINELSIEEYLYAVIPSEMPTYYGLEALKVQAICARSYAYNQLFANGYSEYGAHVDDSISYQVYNNIPENESSILAVKDTYGKVIEFNDSVITAYYFSTSSGHTASLEEVWGNYNKAEYLVGKMQTIYDIVDGEAVYASARAGDKLQPDYSSEESFREFILNPEDTTYDSDFPWYRWEVTISKENIKKSIDKSLANRYTANPALIMTLVDGEINKNPVYESTPIDTVGDVKSIKVGKREKSGIISELIIVGSKNTIKVKTEYNIRTLLAPLYDEVKRQDDTTSPGLSMLPSAFFVMEEEGKSIVIHGGGYGHGVGMSQNGVKAMADSGKDYDLIIKHYYNGVEIGFIY